MTNNVPAEDIEVWVTGPRPMQVGRTPGGFDETGEVETQSKIVDKALDVVRVDSSVFIDSWQKTSRAVQALFEEDNQTDKRGGFVLDSVTARLSLSASGKVAFIGELGGEIAFEAVFKRCGS